MVQPIIGVPNSYASGCIPSFSSLTLINVSAGSVSSSDLSSNLTLDSQQTINLTKRGVNGFDVGSLPTLIPIYLFVIGDALGYHPTSVIASASNIIPSLPSGYNLYRMIGSVALNGISSVRQFVTFGKGELRATAYDIDVFDANVLQNGNSTVYLRVDASSLIPLGANLGVINYRYFGNITNTSYFEITKGGSSLGNNDSIQNYGRGVATVPQTGQFQVALGPNSPTPSFNYRVISGLDALSLYVYGFEFSI